MLISALRPPAASITARKPSVDKPIGCNDFLGVIEEIFEDMGVASVSAALLEVKSKVSSITEQKKRFGSFSVLLILETPLFSF